SGDLVVRVAAKGLAFGGTAHGRLQFVDPKGGPGVSYGDPVWVDALGKRTEVLARFEAQPAGGDIVLSVPAALVARSRFPAVLDPTISPEFPLADSVYGGAGDTAAPIIASDGSGAMV